MAWTLETTGQLLGKTVVVTGANAGIGFETSLALAGKGARVILACRNPSKGKDAIERVKSKYPNATLSLVRLDLGSLASVREFAAQLGDELPTLDVLINNAGVSMLPLAHTSEGLEMQFGTNFIGHFLLTGLLLPLLNRTAAARVVTLSSLAHWGARIDFSNLNAEHGYSKWRAYGQSKLADLLFAYELQRRLARAGATTISIGAHPGGATTELGRHSILIAVIQKFLTQSAAAGALPSLRAATDSEARGGEYYGPGGFATLHGAPVKQRSSRGSHAAEVAARLWEAAERLCGFGYLSAA